MRASWVAGDGWWRELEAAGGGRKACRLLFSDVMVDHARNQSVRTLQSEVTLNNSSHPLRNGQNPSDKPNSACLVAVK